MKRMAIFFSLAAVLIYFIIFANAFSGFGNPTNGTWHNSSWHYRFRIEIKYENELKDWPIDHEINFTDIIPSGTFDDNSIRVFEYDQAGGPAFEVPYQFEQGFGYDAFSNAVGTLVFLVNGTTPENFTRVFYVYYDTAENGAKSSASYSSDINYSWDGKMINVNNSLLRLYFDTNREQNSSGLYKVEDKYSNILFDTTDDVRTAEYSEYYNGTELGFNLIGNATFTNGPVRLKIEQSGDEVEFGNISRKTNEAKIVKRYYIYNRAGEQSAGTFIKIYQRIENTAGYAIIRNSTAAGALAFDINRTISSGFVDSYEMNQSNPFSWTWASGNGGEMLGIINLNSSYSKFYAEYSDSNGRAGIQLNSTTINQNGFIEQTTLAYFAPSGGGVATTEFFSIKDAFTNPPNITIFSPEKWVVIITPSTNATIYNRNETVVIKGNLSMGDPYNFISNMTATIYAISGENATIYLVDDGTNGDELPDDKIFTNIFELPNNATIGNWDINISAYQNSSFYNSTMYTFNVTNIYNIDINIRNPLGLASRSVIADIYVKNFRNDTGIFGANLTCIYNNTEVMNKTDFNNGSYFINFTAPSDEGFYDIFCNVTKNGNYGNVTSNFSTEPTTTTVNIFTIPESINIDNMTLFDAHKFIITANASNFGLGTAYSMNLSLELPSGWSTDQTLLNCGNILKNTTCLMAFNITVPNATAPGNYSFNITADWANPDDSFGYNKTIINVSVFENPVIDIIESDISGHAADGTIYSFGNLTIFSRGNFGLNNINISCISGTACADFNITLNPNNIASLPIGNNQMIFVNVSVPLNYTPGIYNATINASTLTRNDILILHINVSQKTSLTLITIPQIYYSENITQQNNETFSFITNMTNIGFGSARFANITAEILNGWSYSGIQYCENLTKDINCIRIFNATIQNATAPGNYKINMTFSWTNNDNSVNTSKYSLNITVLQNPELNVSEDEIISNVSDGSTKNIGNFTILSYGNYPLNNVTFSCVSGDVCNNFILVFNPYNISSIPHTQNRTVGINVSVPTKFQAGIYNGTINVSANGTYDIFMLMIEVPSNRTWNMTPNTCQRSEFPDEGIVCAVNITNTGNDAINFTITALQENHSTTNATNFTVEKGYNYTFSVLYNITGFAQAVYNTTFMIDALQAAYPDFLDLNVTLLPYLPPIIIINLSTNSTEQNDTIMITANITDASNSGLSWVTANITRVDGTKDGTYMSLIYQDGNNSLWSVIYNDTWGNTTARGTYNVTIYAVDNIGNLGNTTSSFQIYTKLTPTLSTLSSRYYQGDTGSIYYTARSFDGLIPGLNVSFTIKDPNNNTIFSETDQTNNDGMIYPMPTFSLASDSIIGNYILTANADYTDNITNTLIHSEKNSTFLVDLRTISVTGLFADIETAVVWYPDNVMKYGILVYNGEGRPVNPTEMNMTIYDPAGNAYLIVNISQMTNDTTGFYKYNYAMPANSASGMYLAVLNVKQNSFETMKLKSFRVARGGPYDIRITPLKNEVRQGEYLDYILTVENKGEVSQDVFIDSWVSSGSTNYYSASEAVYTPSNSNQSFMRNAYIYSTQPPGTYFINVRVSYDSVQQPILANTTFIVISAVEKPTTPSGGGGGGGSGGGIPTTGQITTKTEEAQNLPESRPQYSILITNYNSNISITKGMTKIEHAIVKNTGRSILRNISLTIMGISDEWYQIKPTNYAEMDIDNSSVFVIEFDIPKDAISGPYQGSLIASANSATDQKGFQLTVFDSLEEMLLAELEKTKSDAKDLDIDIKLAERQGNDVYVPKLLMEEIFSRLDLAERSLKNNMTDNTIENIAEAKKLIEKARGILEKLQSIKPGAGMPFGDILVYIILVLVVLIIIIYFKRKQISPAIRSHILPLKKILDMFHRESGNEEASREREKTARMLIMLEKEKKEGIITERAYKEMKKSMENKLSRLEKKISKSKNP